MNGRNNLILIAFGLLLALYSLWAWRQLFTVVFYGVAAAIPPFGISLPIQPADNHLLFTAVVIFYVLSGPLLTALVLYLGYYLYRKKPARLDRP
ncbi:MAG TPA: hypothetical protein VKS78_11100 [Roseiarcus sp.]|nr:hypothetical protein [Roseiarcus sp.]